MRLQWDCAGFGVAVASSVRGPLGLLGASSLVGQSVLTAVGGHSALAQVRVYAFSRTPELHASSEFVRWCGLRGAAQAVPSSSLAEWICLAPIWTLAEHFDLMQRCGARRVVALSSTSRFTKQLGAASDDPGEHALAQRLEAAEAQFTQWADHHHIEWVILRPTLIYGLGRDKNLTYIARFIRWFGFFPLLGQANGLRQPIHTDDVSIAALGALCSAAATWRAYNISGGETVPYRTMVARVFAAQGRRPRFIQVPLLLFRLGVACLHLFPRYKHWTAAMAQRMNVDMVFDHSDAKRDFGFSARGFLVE